MITKAITELGTCQVRRGTDYPCQRPATVKIRGVPFCEPCAHEQEAYFAIGELTEKPWRLRDKRLGGVLSRLRQTRLERGQIDDYKPDAA